MTRSIIARTEECYKGWCGSGDETPLKTDTVDADNKRELLKHASDVRKFEIEKFWQRSIFFWGFIASAFLAYALLHGDDSDFSLVLIACFGLVCSVAWTLTNDLDGTEYA